MIPRNGGHWRTPRPTGHGWCVEETRPDPGVVDHYSRTWEGGSPADRDASWSVRVTRRDNGNVPERAVVDVEIGGAYANVAGIVAALGEAQRLVDRINAGVRATRTEAAW
jgi:hypothetical protein